MYIRLITALVLIVGAFVAPWWAVGLGVLLCTLAYRRFFEALLPALTLDVLYGAQPIVGIPGFITAVTVGLLLMSLMSDSYLRGHVRI